MEADKGRASKAKAKAKAAAPARASQPRKSSGEKVFSKGGSRYDPLNSSL